MNGICKFLSANSEILLCVDILLDLKLFELVCGNNCSVKRFTMLKVVGFILLGVEGITIILCFLISFFT